jgi:MFS family permease
MENKKEINLFLAKYYLLGAFSAMYFIGSFVMIIVNESIDNAFKISILVAIMSIIKIVFEIPSGAFADRFGRKNTLILAKFLGGLGFVFFVLRRNYTDFLISYSLVGFWLTLQSGALEAFIYDNMKKLNIIDNYAKYQSIYSIVSDVSFGLSTLLASYLILFGYNTVIFATIIGCFICSALVILTIKDTHTHDKNIEKLNKDYFKILKKGLIYSFKHGTILKFIILIVVMNAFLEIISNYYELILFHITNSLPMVPILLAVCAGISAFVQFIMTVNLQRKKSKFAIMIGMFSVFAFFIGFIFYSFPITYIASILFWSGLNIFHHLLNTKKQLLIPSKLRATINSVEGFLLGIAGTLYLLLFGHIVEITSYKIGFIILSAITLVIIIAFLFILGNDKHLRRKESRIGI